VLNTALLLRRLIGSRSLFDQPVGIVRLLVAVAAGTATSATIGVASLRLHGDITAEQVGSVWRTWFLGDSTGVMLVVPLALAWVPPPAIPGWPRARKLEALATLAVVAGLSVATFSSHHPLTYVVFPPLIWATLRFGPVGGTLAMAIAAATALVATANDLGPFVERSIDDEVLSTQLYLLVGSITMLILGALVSERQRAAVALADARRREAEQAAAERQRIARDLHDSVSQTLFSLSLHAGIARHELSRAGVPAESPLGVSLAEVSELSGAALAEMRGLIFELRPDALAEDGLVAALRRHGAAVSARHGVPVSVEGPPEPLALSDDAEEQLYRIAQEALANAARHAAASRISVIVRAAADEIALSIADDGLGFDPAASYPGHLGLGTMRSRAAELGGRLEITSAPGAGTSVELALAGGSA
jgi:signal transduction histidine kinase